MKFAILDGNAHYERDRREIDDALPIDTVVGMPAQWLAWEMQRAGLKRYAPADANVVLFTFSSSIHFRQGAYQAFRQAGLPALAVERKGQPYVVVGGAVDATPRNALRFGDALAVGEGYALVRKILRCHTPAQVKRLLIDDPHAIERSQYYSQEYDEERPWLMPSNPGPLAEPDNRVDWSIPDVRGNDGVTRVIGSKGCHLKCGFCSTTYRQQYATRPAADLRNRVAHWSEERADDGKKHRPQIVSNDPLNLPGFDAIRGRLSFASVTLMELMDDAHLEALAATRPKLVRVGVEGVSERIRRNFGKAIRTADLLERLARLHQRKVNTKTFWIQNAPYETADDWNGWFSIWRWWSQNVDWGVHRFKLTPFSPTPPAPLCRFAPNPENILSWNIVDQLAWMMSDGPNRRSIPDGMPRIDTQWNILREQMQMPSAMPMPEIEGTLDLAPDYADWQRMPSEVIRWPVSQAQRYNIGQVYRRRMTGDAAPKVMVPAAALTNPQA